jgi:hypothetical protein
MRYDEISGKTIINKPVKPFSQFNITSSPIFFSRDNGIFAQLWNIKYISKGYPNNKKCAVIN